MNKKRKLARVSWLGHKTIGLTSFRKLAIIFILFFTLFGLTNPVFANQANNSSIGRIIHLDPAQDEATSTPISVFTDSPTNPPVEPELTATDVPSTQTPVFTQTSNLLHQQYPLRCLPSHNPQIITPTQPLKCLR